MFLGAVGGPGGDDCAEVVHCPEGTFYRLSGRSTDEWKMAEAHLVYFPRCVGKASSVMSIGEG